MIIPLPNATLLTCECRAKHWALIGTKRQFAICLTCTRIKHLPTSDPPDYHANTTAEGTLTTDE